MQRKIEKSRMAVQDKNEWSSRARLVIIIEVFMYIVSPFVVMRYSLSVSLSPPKKKNNNNNKSSIPIFSLPSSY